MASMNGVLSPPSNPDSANSSLTLSAKRKREDSTEIQSHINGISSSTSATTSGETKASIKNLIDILKSHDPSPSILTRSLPERTSSSEPQAKRQKSENISEPSTILARVTSNVYAALDDVLDDIDLAVNDIMEKLELTSATARNQYQQIDPRKSELSLKVSAFKQKSHELVQNDKASKAQHLAMTNGITSTGGTSSKSLTNISTQSNEKKLVLTLYGNAPQPKQLFSSLQLSTKVPGENRDIVQPLREAGLPNGIATTQVVPIQATVVDEKKRVQTLGELFPTPSTIPQLQPPKPSKIATTRSSTVGWYHPASANPPPARSSIYSQQSISTGHWLDYSNASPAQSAKRKQRDRAMSLSGAKAPQLDVEPVESEATKLEALFRSAYSGFAPTKDDAAAVVPEGTINRLWWQRVGEKSFERLVENTNRLEGVASTKNEEVIDAIDDTEEDKNFREAVEFFETEAIDPNLEASVEKSAEEKDVEEILDGISELLETLNSYQRIRHMSLNSLAGARPAGLLSTTDTTTLGTPSKPSEPEIATYEVLKSQLSLMISSLPPFAVAKLDPNQLAELGISTKIPIQVENYKGVMEEDEASAKAKAAALSAASTSRTSQPTSLPRTNSTALYGNQYAQRPAAPQYYGAQTPIRPPVNNLHRAPSTAPAPFPAQRPSATPYRPASYGTPPNYPHQNPRPIQQQYTANSSQQYVSTPTQGYARPVGQTYQGSQSYQGAPQSAGQAPPTNPRYPQASFPQPASTHSGGMDYRYSNGSNTGRQPSPQKPMYSPQPTVSQGGQSRPAYSAPTPSMTPDRRPFLQNPMAQTPHLNGGSSQSPQPQHVQQQPLGPTNYSTFMTTEQQSSMMERQRAQLAQQQAGTQQQARQMAQAAMGSPSKTGINGGIVAAGI